MIITIKRTQVFYHKINIVTIVETKKIWNHVSDNTMINHVHENLIIVVQLCVLNNKCATKLQYFHINTIIHLWIKCHDWNSQSSIIIVT